MILHMDRTLILSPHFDDAVLSCFHLAGQQCTVINVFDSLPPADAPMTEWDLRTGSTSARERMIERRAEDASAMSLTAWTALGLGLYRPDTQIGDVIAALEGVVEASDKVVVPAGIGRHPAHVMVRDAALALDANVYMYADHPYATSVDTAQLLNVHQQLPLHWQVDLERPRQLLGELGDLEIHQLTAAQAQLKMEAVGCYATQLDELNLVHAGAATDPERLALEFTWHVS